MIHVAEGNMIDVAGQELPVIERPASHVAGQVTQNASTMPVRLTTMYHPVTATEPIDQRSEPGGRQIFGQNNVLLITQRREELATEQQHHHLRREHARAPGRHPLPGLIETAVCDQAMDMRVQTQVAAPRVLGEEISRLRVEMLGVFAQRGENIRNRPEQNVLKE